HFTVDTPSLGSGPVAVELTPLLGLLIDRLGTGGIGEESRELTERMILDVLRPSVHELVLAVPRAGLISPIVETVRDDPADQTTLTAWASRIGVSSRTVTRTFEAETGLGFSRWVAMARVKHAVALLGVGHEVSEVAERVGYRSASAFITAFRRATGVTPGQFRAPALVSDPSNQLS
ncbi:MAG: AraC family transcriptional regulator, partial [Corynebacterium sp.]|nr:AraC family transcriptional regulator [Corynebacterium sp.]